MTEANARTNTKSVSSRDSFSLGALGGGDVGWFGVGSILANDPVYLRLVTPLTVPPGQSKRLRARPASFRDAIGKKVSVGQPRHPERVGKHHVRLCRPLDRLLQERDCLSGPAGQRIGVAHGRSHA